MFDFTIDKQTTSKTIEIKSLYDIIVIGAGPGGFNAALYAKRKGLNVLLVSKSLGGQLVNTNLIENYLGFKSISGEKLSDVYLEHIDAFDVPLALNLNIENIVKDNDLFYLDFEDGTKTTSKVVIIATGGSPRKLNIPGEEPLIGSGVSYCAICDGPFYKDKDVAVIGGGNSALEAAIDLAKIAKSVTIVQLEEDFTADKILVDQFNKFDNVASTLHSQAKEFINKDGFLHGLKYLNLTTNEEHTILIDGAFIEIGVIPNNNVVKDLVELNRFGEVITDIEQQTSLEGMYAVGDVTNFPYKQIVTAASQGAVAALSANNYINKKEQEK